MYIDGLPGICPNGGDSNSTYKLIGQPNNDPITWTCTSNISLSGTSGKSATFAVINSMPDYATITASFSGTSVSKTIIVNNYPTLAQFSESKYTNTLFNVTPPFPDAIATFNWTVGSAPSPTAAKLYYTSGPMNMISFAMPGTYVINVFGVSICNMTAAPTYIYTYTVTSNPTGYSYTTYPNPANDLLNIEIGEDESAQPAFAPAITGIEATDAPLLITNDEQSKNFDIRLYNEMGVQLRQTTVKKGEKVQFNLSNLPNGNYYLHIYDGINDKPEMKQIVIKR